MTITNPVDPQARRTLCGLVQVWPPGQAGKRFQAPEEAAILGREADWCVLEDYRVSRHHARIRRMGTGLTIADIGSTHGTWLGARPLAGPRRAGEDGPAHGLIAQDVLRLGDSLFVVEPPPAAQASNVGRRLVVGCSAWAIDAHTELVDLARTQQDLVIEGPPGAGRLHLAMRTVAFSPRAYEVREVVECRPGGARMSEWDLSDIEGGTLIVGDLELADEAMLAAISKLRDVRLIGTANAGWDRPMFEARLGRRLTPFQVPPLSRRKADIPTLCLELLESLAPGMPQPGAEVIETLLCGRFPAHVDTLADVLARASRIGLTPVHLEWLLDPVGPPPAPLQATIPAALTLRIGLQRLDERRYLVTWGPTRKEFPRTSGLDFLAEIVAQRPHPVPAATLARTFVETTQARLDAVAHNAYKEARSELIRELEGAEECHDEGLKAILHVQLDALEERVLREFGKGGRVRPMTGDAQERARINVKTQLSRALALLDEELPELANHLRQGLKTGRRCSYEERLPNVEWLL